jgi:hypothetical protein
MFLILFILLNLGIWLAFWRFVFAELGLNPPSAVRSRMVFRPALLGAFRLVLLLAESLIPFSLNRAS